MAKPKKITKSNIPLDEEKMLMKLTEEALIDVLGRQPTRHEILRTHVGFKRMAFILLDHLDHIKKEEDKS
ncbi:MAG: hypothetical protein Q7S32_01090 [bacterium]|nr:hypothetical protein [bacterium]